MIYNDEEMLKMTQKLNKKQCYACFIKSDFIFIVKKCKNTSNYINICYWHVFFQYLFNESIMAYLH